MSRLQETLRTQPPVTVFVISLCCILFLFQNALSWPLHNLTLCPRLVLRNHEFYRVFTSALFHGSVMHIGMNMISAGALLPTVENKLGSLRLSLTICLSILLTSTIYIAIAVLLVLLGYPGLMNQHSVGFSGVLFHISVIECNLGLHQSRSIFGLVTVPSFAYPWILLIILQFIVPNLSFTGHLAGILLGSAQVHGFLNGIMPSTERLRSLEASSLLRSVTAWPSYVSSTDISFHSSLEICQFLSVSIRYLWYIVETVIVMTCGRSFLSRLSRIPIELQQSQSIGLLDVDQDSDDEWTGLPEAPQTSDIV